jgi:hypothetical protein
LVVPAVLLFVVKASGVASVVSERRTKVPVCAEPSTLANLPDAYEYLPAVLDKAYWPIAVALVAAAPLSPIAIEYDPDAVLP